MSFFREGSIILFLEQKPGAPVYLTLLLLLGFFIGLNNTLCAQECASPSKSTIPSSLKLNTERSSYIQESVGLLKAMSQGGCDNPGSAHHIILEEGDLYRHRLFVGYCCVTFPNGDNLYFPVHSGHEHESILNLTPATNQQGRLYPNEGRVRGAIIHFSITEKGSLQSVDNYVHNLKTDTDEKPFCHLTEHLNFQ